MDINLKKCTEEEPGVFKKNDNTYYIICSLAGTVHYCNKARLDKLVKKHGSLKKLGTEYISRAAKTSISKESKKEKQVKSKTTAGPKVIKLPPPEHVIIKQVDASIGAAASKGWTRCLRSDIFRSNNGHCNGCRWWKTCKYTDKSWAAVSIDSRPDALTRLRKGVIVYTEGEHWTR